LTIALFISHFQYPPVKITLPREGLKIARGESARSRFFVILQTQKSKGGAKMQDPRTAICHTLGILNVLKAHEIIAVGVEKGVESLLHRGLNAKNLIALGYDAAGLARMGYTPAGLKMLGYPGYASAGAPQNRAEAKTPRTHAPAAGNVEENAEPILKQLISSGIHAHELKDMGYTIHHCKRAGFSAGELEALGFQLNELATAYGAGELRRADFQPRELSRFFSGHELKSAGFSASDLRNAGYSIRELLNLGFNENHVRGAGFSQAEMLREGVTKTTRPLE
jgi:hypothetical protein